jgi:signal transduction histidine kinase
MATHELRTPLTVITGYIELLSAAASARLAAEEQEFLDIVRTSATTLTALVDDLLDLARIEAGRLELVVRPVNIAEALDRVCRMVAAQAAAKGLDLQIDVAPNLPLVGADLNRLVQILLNLLGNAIKFTESGRVRCVVRARRGGVETRVIDTGIGISSDALPRIFDEFRQADAGTTRKFGGSGLGLAIAKRLIEMQGGTIGVTSKVGVGSTFTLWLPSATAQLLHDDRQNLEQTTPLPTPISEETLSRPVATTVRARRGTVSRRA